ncbi:hypothetical protein GCM10023115_50000 [Pontixanthobacter gangjinensis]|uniref:Sensor of ECF-type sigma factor n=1 Tax=Christiangramia aestuarii TaxID=1028746 RepID=A0A7K1LPL5_9FLAO|nr:hypothetical protein [Christiangramia aestuarii]MUP42581.1 hypothetical protein [Christiangramia aestuarii]
MKKIAFTLLVLFTVFQTQAQEERDEKRERIKALKVAYFTQELKLDEQTAAKFWPIYNKYEEQRRELHKREHVELKNVECMSENEAENLLDEFLSVESAEYKIKKQLFKDLKQIISAKDIIKLHELEDEFHKKLIKEYRSKREQKGVDSSE